MKKLLISVISASLLFGAMSAYAHPGDKGKMTSGKTKVVKKTTAAKWECPMCKMKWGETDAKKMKYMCPHCKVKLKKMAMTPPAKKPAKKVGKKG